MTFRLRAKEFSWYYDFYDTRLSTELLRRHMIKEFILFFFQKTLFQVALKGLSYLCIFLLPPKRNSFSLEVDTVVSLFIIKSHLIIWSKNPDTEIFSTSYIVKGYTGYHATRKRAWFVRLYCR